MIRWHQTHSGVYISLLLVLSIATYYIVLVGPWDMPVWLFSIFYFLPSAFFVAVIDHGHMNTPLLQRLIRLLVSWAVAMLWMIVAASVLINVVGGDDFFSRPAADIWKTIWPMGLIAGAMAIVGIIIVRWIERQSDPFSGPVEKKLTRVIRRDNMIIGKQV